MKKYGNRVEKTHDGKDFEGNDGTAGSSQGSVRPKPPRRAPRTAAEKAEEKAIRDQEIAESAANVTASFDKFVDEIPPGGSGQPVQNVENVFENLQREEDSEETVASARAGKGSGKKSKKRKD